MSYLVSHQHPEDGIASEVRAEDGLVVHDRLRAVVQNAARMCLCMPEVLPPLRLVRT